MLIKQSWSPFVESNAHASWRALETIMPNWYVLMPLETIIGGPVQVTRAHSNTRPYGNLLW